MRRFYAFAIVAASFASGCTHDNYQVKKLDSDPIDAKGSTNDGTVGLNSKNEVVIRKETAADDALRVQEMSNADLAEKLSREHYLLKRCRDERADPRLGGDGNVAPLPDVDNMKDADQVREDMGLDDQGDLKIVQTQYYADKLKGERKYQESLRSMLKTIEPYREKCERELGYARTQHGLPPERYKAEGYFSADGVWVETRKAENSLDDAFEISAQERSKAQAKGEH